MGRKKLEIKLITNKSKNQVTFSKRRNGLIEKARQLSILCDVDLGLIICSSRGKLHTFSDSNNSLPEILQKYHNHMETESEAITETEQDHSTIGTFSTIKDLLDAVERHLVDPDQLSKTDFICLENQLEAALLETRARKTQLMMGDVTKLEEKEKMLTEENRLLAEQIVMENEKMKKTPVTLKLF